MNNKIDKVVEQLFQQAMQAEKLQQFSLAKAIYQKIIDLDLYHHKALYRLGLMHLSANDNENACVYLQRYIANGLDAEQDKSEVFYHYAQALSQNNDDKNAIAYYQQAIKIDPNEADYYFGLAESFFQLEQYQQAQQAYKKAVELNANDYIALNQLAACHVLQDDIEKGIYFYQQSIKHFVNYAPAYFHLGLLYKRIDLHKSIEYLQQATALLMKDNSDKLLLESTFQLAEVLYLKGDYSQVANVIDDLSLNENSKKAMLIKARSLMQLSRFEEALHCLNELLVDFPLDKDIAIAFASLYFRLQQIEKAKTVLTSFIVDDLKKQSCSVSDDINNDILKNLRNVDVDVLFYYAQCLEYQGDFKHAEKLHYYCWQQKPNLTAALYHLSMNGQYQPSSADFSTIESLLNQQNLANASKLSIDERINLYFASAKLYEKKQTFDKAFEYYQKANDFKASVQAFNATAHAAYIQQIINTFDEKYFAQRLEIHSNNDEMCQYGSSDIAPIFIVGMPRSGSTLLAQILSAHSDVINMGEQMAMPQLIKLLPSIVSSNDDDIFACFNKIDVPLSKSLAEQYLKNVFAEDEKLPKVFVDKMLGNFLRLGLIALLFPNAKIIYTRRNALETCWSCYTQNFANGYRFANDFESLAYFYQSHIELMAHWQKVLPIKIYTLDYEELIDSPNEQIKSILDYCQLPWQDDCLAFNQQKSSVATASYWQVRQPMYKSAQKKAHDYLPYIQDLINKLK